MISNISKLNSSISNAESGQLNNNVQQWLKRSNDNHSLLSLSSVTSTLSCNNNNTSTDNNNSIDNNCTNNVPILSNSLKLSGKEVSLIENRNLSTSKNVQSPFIEANQPNEQVTNILKSVSDGILRGMLHQLSSTNKYGEDTGKIVPKNSQSNVINPITSFTITLATASTTTTTYTYTYTPNSMSVSTSPSLSPSTFTTTNAKAAMNNFDEGLGAKLMLLNNYHQANKKLDDHFEPNLSSESLSKDLHALSTNHNNY